MFCDVDKFNWSAVDMERRNRRQIFFLNRFTRWAIQLKFGLTRRQLDVIFVAVL